MSNKNDNIESDKNGYNLCEKVNKVIEKFTKDRSNDVFVKINDQNKPLFIEILEKFFNKELFNSTKSVSLAVNDYLRLLKIVFENPVQSLINFIPDWLFVYNPLLKELSLVHLIIEKTKLKDLIDDEASEAILESSSYNY